MELLIFSDSHGNRNGMRRALEQQPRIPNAICFLGDGLRDAEALDTARSLLYTVRGNCDGGASADGIPNDRVFCAEGHTVFLTHGHLYGVKSGCGALASHAASLGADIVLFGHTHQPTELRFPPGHRLGEVVLTRPLHLFNPGSIGNGTFGTLLLQKNTVLFSVGQSYGI